MKQRTMHNERLLTLSKDGFWSVLRPEPLP